MKQSIILALAITFCHCSVFSRALNLTDFHDFDRLHMGVGGDIHQQRIQVCKPLQIQKAEACILAPIPFHPIPHTFYTDTIDALALSEFVYEITKMRGVDARTRDMDLYATPDSPLSFQDAHNFVQNNIELLKDDDEQEVQEAIKFMNAFHVDDDLACIRDEEMSDAHKIIKFGDSQADVSNSRVHMIAVDHHKKRVDVVFRGTQRMGDWATNLNALWRRRVRNPVQIHQKKTSRIHLHRGFAEALLGNASSPDLPNTNDIACNDDDDDDGTPIKSILCDIKPFMKNDYRLVVTGHSLGGATATLFAFFAASTDPDNTRAGPVGLFTFASPRVGGRTFQDAFKFLEERGKIRHARFRNQKDKVPMMPYLGGMYSHVGIEFRLRKDEIPILDYPTSHAWTQKGLNLIENILSLGKALYYHGTNTMLERIKVDAKAFNNTSLQQEYQMIWGV